MVQIVFILAIAFIIHLRALQYALIVAKNKSIIPFQRFVFSMLILSIPLLGIVIYHFFRYNLREKEYKFFSERFIEKLHRSKQPNFFIF
jgi:hypothetical protein